MWQIACLYITDYDWRPHDPIASRDLWNNVYVSRRALIRADHSGAFDLFVCFRPPTDFPPVPIHAWEAA